MAPTLSPSTESLRAAGRFGLGAAPLGNLFQEIDDAEATAIVDGVWDSGIRVFDTAPHYGLGLSEQRLGAALAHRPRDEFVLSTKVGRLLEPDPSGAGRLDDEGFVVEATTRRRWDFSADGARRSLESSLERLGMDRVDIVHLHDPEGRVDEAIDGALPALVALRDAGVISAVGVGSKDPATLTRIIETGMVDVAMVAGRYTLLEQPAAVDVLPAALAHGVAVIAVGVYNSGLLATPHPDPAAPYEYGTAPEAVYRRAVRLADACAARGVPLPVAALHFPLRHPAVVNVTVGLGKASHVAQTAGYMNEPPTEDFWRGLAEEGLVPEGER